ncbi:MAG TPA: hypothetical protein VHY79_07105, partial [Rhizomicrobium sp.]|nr:hypothetical protein [Rhizomicrobium sp.]
MGNRFVIIIHFPAFFPSVTGLWKSIPFAFVRSPGSRFCPWSADAAYMMESERQIDPSAPRA